MFFANRRISSPLPGWWIIICLPYCLRYSQYLPSTLHPEGVNAVSAFDLYCPSFASIWEDWRKWIRLSFKILRLQSILSNRLQFYHCCGSYQNAHLNFITTITTVVHYWTQVRELMYSWKLCKAEFWITCLSLMIISLDLVELISMQSLWLSFCICFFISVHCLQ